MKHAIQPEGSFVVYILRTDKNTLYIGQTSNLAQRLDQHRQKKQGAKYLRSFTNFDVVHTEYFSSRSLALKREYTLKQLTKKQKEALITTDII